MTNDLLYCKDKVAKDGSDLYYALYFHPIQQQHALLALFAFDNELNYIANHIEDPGVARVKIHWWQDELQRLQQSQGRHPLSHLLQDNTDITEDVIQDMQQMITLTDSAIQSEPSVSATIQQQIQSQLWQLAGKICAAKDTASQLLLGQTAANVAAIRNLNIPSDDQQHGLLLAQIKQMQERHCPLFAIILSRITHAGSQKTNGIVPIYKLWIAWRSHWVA